MMLKEQLIETEEPYPSVAEPPHFDEEWTVLSARPVVPIAELETKERRCYSLKLFGAFLLASSLGVLVALTSIRIKESNSTSSQDGPVSEESATVEANTIVTPQTGDSSAQNSATMQTSEMQTSEMQTSDVEAAATYTAITPKRSVKRFEPKSPPIIIDSDDELRQISREELRRVSQEKTSTGSSQPKLVDQWQERRQRRVEQKRPLNDRGNHHPRDLSNLDEIFEGSSKPPDRRY